MRWTAAASAEAWNVAQDEAIKTLDALRKTAADVSERLRSTACRRGLEGR